MHEMLEKVKKTISKHRLLTVGERVIVGFSGGVDSLCLLHILKNLAEYDLELWALYINHSLRPAENLQEESLLYDLGDKWGIRVKEYTVNIPERLKEKPQSIQLLAREERYKIFNSFREEINACKVALAHHCDDQVETVLYRIIRGTGLDGLAGMPVARDGVFIRPLLAVSRSEIMAYVKGHGLTWVEDSSNSKLVYQRNKIRRQLIPQIEEAYNPRFKEALLRLAQLADEQRDYMEQIISGLSGKISVSEPERVGIKLKPFLDLHSYARYCFLKEVISKIRPNYQIEQVSFQRLLEKISVEKFCFKPVQIYRGITVYVENEILYFEELEDLPPEFDGQTFSIAKPGATLASEFNLRITAEPGEIPGDWSKVGKDEIFVSAGELKYPLTLRFWRPGDFFKPLGISGTQKLQDFFINRKIPRRLRSRTPLLVNGDGRIIWIIGYQMSEEFKLGPNVTGVWHISASKLMGPLSREMDKAKGASLLN